MNNIILTALIIACSCITIFFTYSIYMLYTIKKAIQKLSTQQETQQTDTKQEIQLLNTKSEQANSHIQQLLQNTTNSQLEQLQKLNENLITQNNKIITTLHQHQNQNIQSQQKELRAIMTDIREQLTLTLSQQNKATNNQIKQLQEKVDQHLSHIGSQVEKRLEDGFNKTNTIFTDVIKRLALIDQAQQKITDLSTNVIGLQDILSNKQARGHFGEIQLEQLIKNCLPTKYYSLQHSFSNKKRADCVLFLPKPTGTVAIDAKFPLENYRLMLNSNTSETKHKACQNFRQDIKHHIKCVSEKYIIPGETSDAVMIFIPAESIFSEIHANHSDLIDFAYQNKTWLASPTTMMAIVHTAQAVIKDKETQAQVHIIQEHLRHLSADFNRFNQRMFHVAKHIADAQDKVEQVKTSADKISKRFNKIENIELSTPAASALDFNE